MSLLVSLDCVRYSRTMGEKTGGVVGVGWGGGGGAEEGREGGNRCMCVRGVGGWGGGGGWRGVEGGSKDTISILTDYVMESNHH